MAAIRKTPALLIVSLLSMGFTSMSPAQSDFELRILNPTGYVEPGQRHEIIAELINPIDSGLTIERVSGGGFRSGGSLGLAAMDLWIGRTMELSQRLQRMPPQYRVVAGAYPVRPGQSFQFVLRELWIPENAASGSDIRLSGLSAKFDTGNPILKLEVYADLDVVRITSADGQGDAAIFERMNLLNPQAGMLHTQLLAEFRYPNEIVAGEAFDLEVTITNQAEAAIEINYPAFGNRAGLRSWSGEHDRSYRFIPCTRGCLISGIPVLAQGDRLSLKMGRFYYENEEFFDGRFMLEDFVLNVIDGLNRHENVLAIADPISVSVTHTPGNEALYRNDDALPESLQQRDLNGPGDARVIYDPNTSLEWLKLSAGATYSLARMLAETGLAGLFEGFSLASSQQVETLLLNHMNSSGMKLRDYALYSTIGSVQSLQSLVGLLGNIPTINDTLGFNGMVNDSLPAGTDSNPQYTIVEASVTSAGPDTGLVMVNSTQGFRKYTRTLENLTSAYTGYWLVR